MRFRVILSLMTMAMACFTVAVWNSPTLSEGRQNAADDRDDEPGDPKSEY
jgi:hypothetical protein